MRLFVTDCEGPISKNDNAMELTAEFVPAGERLFAVLSAYDDYLAYVEHRPGYKAGDTLRLILPFLKVYGATDPGIEDYSHRHILLVPGADETLRRIRTWMPAFAREIAHMPVIDWSEDARGLPDLAPPVRTAVERLNEIFWKKLSGMIAGRLLEDVNPIGGEGKAIVVRDIIRREGAQTDDVMYVGDSITDVQALKLVRTGHGLAVSFNGNRYALEAAQVASVGGHTAIIAVLARLFFYGGTDFVLEFLHTRRPDMGRAAGLTDQEQAYAAPDVVEELADHNRSLWIEKSQAVRKKVRGIQIGSLG